MTMDYYIAYKKDRDQNFFLEDMTEGEMLDHIMKREDGDLGNYEVYLRII